MGSRLQCGVDYKCASGFWQRKRDSNLFPGCKQYGCPKNRNYCYWRANLYREASHCALHLFSLAILSRCARRCANRNGRYYSRSVLYMECRCLLFCCRMDYKCESVFRQRKRNCNLFPGCKPYGCRKNRDYYYWRANLYRDASGRAILRLLPLFVFRRSFRGSLKRNGECYNRGVLYMERRCFLCCRMDYKRESVFRQRKRNCNLFPGCKQYECPKNRDYYYWRANLYRDASGSALLHLFPLSVFRRIFRGSLNRNGECYSRSVLYMESSRPHSRMDYKRESLFR